VFVIYLLKRHIEINAKTKDGINKEFNDFGQFNPI
jgi:hypothetical protein